MQTNKRKVIVVLGMHRSGTSALSGMLQRLGVSFGSMLIPPIRGVNEKGFFEHSDIVQLHDQLLESFGLCWMDFKPLPQNWLDAESVVIVKRKIRHIIDRDFSEAELWGLKDPRLCVLFPIWTDVLNDSGCELKIVRIHRTPDEVVQSLNKRDDLDLQSGYLLWLRYVFESHKVTGHLNAVDVTYDSLLNDWKPVAQQISETLDLDLFQKSADGFKHIESFISSDLKHYDNPILNYDDDARELANDVYSALLSGDNIFEYYDQFEAKVDSLSGIYTYLAKINELRARYQSCRRELDAERENAMLEIEYREALIKDIKGQLGNEKDNAKAQIKYRDALAEGLKKQIGDEKNNAKAQIEYRDELTEKLKKQLDDEKNNAKAQVEYRDLCIHELQDQIDRLESSPLIDLVFNRIKKKIFVRNNR